MPANTTIAPQAQSAKATARLAKFMGIYVRLKASAALP